MVRRCMLGLAMLGVFLALMSFGVAVHASDDSVDELKERLSRASKSDQPGICVQIAHLQLNEANKLYVGNEPEKAAAALGDVASYSEQAGNAAIESRSHEKQTEISMRKMIRRLTDMKRAAVQEDQVAIQSTIGRLERVRDSLLGAMFPKHPPK